MKTIIYKLIILIVLGGCASQKPIDQFSLKELKQEQVTKRSPFSGLLSVTGITISNTVRDGLSEEIERYYLTSRYNQSTKEITHSATLLIMFSGDWRFYNGIRFVGGKNREVDSSLQSVASCYKSSCRLIETISVNFTHDELKNFTSNGLLFDVVGKMSPRNPVIFFPPNYIQAQIEEIESLKTTIASKERW